MATIKIVHYLSKTLADGSNPVYLRLSEKGTDYYLPIYRNDSRFRAYPTQWDEANCRFTQNKKVVEEHKLLNEILKRRETILRNIIQGFVNNQIHWTIKMVREHFYNDFDKTSVTEFITNSLERKKGIEADNCSIVLKNLQEFNSNKKIAFTDVDYDFVKEFIGFFKHKGLNDTTIGIRLRYLRLILNEAIAQGIGSTSTYPFSKIYGAKKSIQISKFEKAERKIAIDLSLIEKIKDASFENHKIEVARRLFLASYAGRGMNFRDMANMKVQNQYKVGQKTYMRYRRGKTSALINFSITPLLQEQLDWFKRNCEMKFDQVFPIGSNVKNELDLYNYRLKKIKKELDIDESIKLSSYVARHTFATNLYHNSVDVGMISQALSHSSVATTKAYLKQFDEDAIDNEIEKVIG